MKTYVKEVLLPTLGPLALAIVVALLIAGCQHFPTPAEHGSVIQTAKDGTKTENLSDNAAYYKTKLELANKPLFEMTCPTNGCMVLSLKVNNPNAANDIAAPVPTPKQESAFVGVAREFKEALVALTPLGMAGIVGHTVAKMADSASRTSEAMAGKIQAPAGNSTVTNTASGGSAIGGNATNTPTTTSTSTTNTNSGNTSLNCASGTATGGTTTAQGAPSGSVTCR